MILQLILLVAIILLALYMANEGALSALLLLLASFFASMLAIGLYQVASKPIMHHRPDFAYGVTFVLIFFIAFSVIRTAFDYLIRGDVNLPLWPGRIAGGIFGFFTALILIGSVMVGIQMMPLPSSILGYDRYSSAADLANNSPSGLWLDPDGFVISLWNIASSGSLGGSSFAKYHPQPLREFYADRYTVQYTGKKTLPPGLLHVKFAGPLAQKLIKKYNIPTAGKQVILVRTEVVHGDTQPNISSDQGYFRLTPAEVQLVTTDGQMYFPAGYLEFGRHYVPLKLNDPMVDDYQNVAGDQVVVQNWIFIIASNDKPFVFRMKQTASVNLLTGLFSQSLKPLPKYDYPQLPYNNSSLDITLDANKLSVAPVHIWVLPASTLMSYVDIPMQDVSGRLQQINQALKNGQPPWSSATIKGKPNTSSIRFDDQKALNLSNQHDSSWQDLLTVMFTSQIGTSTNDSLTRMRTYLSGSLEPLLSSQRIDSGTLNAQGRLKAPFNLAPGHYTIMIWSSSAAQLRVWVTLATVKEGEKSSVKVVSDDKLVDYSLSQ